MQTIRKSADRGQTRTYWLDSLHSFSFGEYHDRAHMGFGPLRVINEDFVRAEAGFPMHGHANMEIITYVLSGALEHKDSLGNGSAIRPLEVQMMSAGKGILHSEFNPSKDEDVHLLQIWIMPSERGTRPSYQQTAFDAQEFRNRLRLIVSPDGAEGSLKILQDAKLYAARMENAAVLSAALSEKRKYWLQVARGSVEVAGKTLAQGDALALENEGGKADIKATADAEILFFDLPQ